MWAGTKNGSDVRHEPLFKPLRVCERIFLIYANIRAFVYSRIFEFFNGIGRCQTLTNAAVDSIPIICKMTPIKNPCNFNSTTTRKVFNVDSLGFSHMYTRIHCFGERLKSRTDTASQANCRETMQPVNTIAIGAHSAARYNEFCGIEMNDGCCNTTET